MLEVKNVSKQYKGEDKLLFDAVSDVSLSMADHRIYALVGGKRLWEKHFVTTDFGIGIPFIRANPTGW